VLTGDIAFSYVMTMEAPGSVEGALDIDFGDDGRISGSILLEEPAWYRDSHVAVQLPEADPDEMTPEQAIATAEAAAMRARLGLLPRQASLHMSGVTIDGAVLAALSGGRWPGLDVTLALDFDLTVPETGDTLAITGSIESNLVGLRVSATGLYGALMRQAFNVDRTHGSGVELIEWTAASLS
jgi:hypothetical protein